MNKKFSEKTHNKHFTPEILMQPTVSSDNPILFQIFFLSPDQNQSVEIVETDIIDFGEITQRVKSGESVFIKNKNQQTLESYYKNKEENQNFWYFTHC